MDLFLAFVAGALTLYGFAHLSAWRKWRAQPTRYELPPGFYRVTRPNCVRVECPRFVDREGETCSFHLGLYGGVRGRSSAAHVGDLGHGEDWSYE